MKQFWIVVYYHQYGNDAWPVWQDTPPYLDEIAAELDDFDGDEEYLELFGPFIAS